GGADAQVELPVLSASDAFVEAVEGLEDLTPVDAEVGRFGLLRLIAGMVGGTAEADRGHVGAGDGLLEGGPASGEHEPTAVRGLGLAQGVDGLLSVFGVEPGVGVDADDDRVTGRGEGEVAPGRGRGVRIVDGLDARIGRGHLGDDGVRVVRRGSEGEDDFLVPVVVLAEDRGDRLSDVFGLVEHRHDVGDSGLLGQRRQTARGQDLKYFRHALNLPTYPRTQPWWAAQEETEGAQEGTGPRESFPSGS